MQLVKIILFFLLSGFVQCNAGGQTIDWSKTTNWMLYDLKGQKGFGVSIDSLHSFRSIPLQVDTIHFFLASATAWPKEKKATWMGEFVATCELEGVIHKIDI